MTLEQLTTAAEFLVLLAIVTTLVFLLLRIRHGAIYRTAVGVALMTVLFLTWINLAVGIIGEPENTANLLYFGVPAVGFIGGLVTRFQPIGMSRALLATALAQVLVAIITLLAGLGAPVTPALTYLVLNGLLIALWVTSALLFRKAAQAVGV